MSFLRRQLIFIMLTLMPATANASGALPSLVEDIGICVVFAGILAIAFTKLKIPVIAAFLIAGIAVGPIGAKLVTDPANIETISELGLILLLFLIGLEILGFQLLDVTHAVSSRIFAKRAFSSGAMNGLPCTLW